MNYAYGNYEDQMDPIQPVTSVKHTTISQDMSPDDPAFDMDENDPAYDDYDYDHYDNRNGDEDENNNADIKLISRTLPNTNYSAVNNEKKFIHLRVNSRASFQKSTPFNEGISADASPGVTTDNSSYLDANSQKLRNYNRKFNNKSKLKALNSLYDDLNDNDEDAKDPLERDEPTRLTAQPNFDHQNKLWEELSALYDVKRAAKTMSVYDEFPKGLEDNLLKLKQLHVKLVQSLRERNAKLEEKKRREITNVNSNLNPISTGTSNQENDTLSSTNNNLSGNKDSVKDSHEVDNISNAASTVIKDDSAYLNTTTNKIIKRTTPESVADFQETSATIQTMIDTIKQLKA